MMYYQEYCQIKTSETARREHVKIGRSQYNWGTNEIVRLVKVPADHNDEKAVQEAVSYTHLVFSLFLRLSNCGY